jgi:hypothetical protein
MAWYLDIVAKKWDALIWGDYEFVMPLPKSRKYFLIYITQPYFAQQLGIFPAPPENIQNYFSDELSNKFKLISYQLNWQMSPDAFSEFKLSKRINLILPLNSDFEKIYNRFTIHTQRNIRRAEKADIVVTNNVSPDEYLKYFESKYTVPQKVKKQLTELMHISIKNMKGHIYGVFTPENRLCAAAFFIRSNKRIIILNTFSTETGRRNRAMFAIINKFISDNSNSDFLLDFEGSNIDGIARFYRGFGSFKETYFSIYKNKYPVFIKLFTK